MGFPDDFQFTGSKIEIARQIGNAVPPPLAGAVARHIRMLMDSWAESALLVPRVMTNGAESN